MSTKLRVYCRFSYLHCWEPAGINGSEPKYSVSAIIPKGDTETINQIKKAVDDAISEGITSLWGGKKPTSLKLPLRDGDIERPNDEAYKGCYFFNANSNQAPQVVDRMKKTITDHNEVYSGCYGNISVTIYPFNSQAQKGVAVGLGNIQKIRDGESLGGRTTADEDFDVVTTEDDDDFLS